MVVKGGQQAGADEKNTNPVAGVNTLTISVFANPKTGVIESLGIGETQVLSRAIYTSGLFIAICDIIYIDLYDDRRPRLELFQPTSDRANRHQESISNIVNNRLMTGTEIGQLEKNHFVEVMSDLIMLNGKILYVRTDGVCAVSGVYGPYRIITKLDKKIITEAIDKKYDLRDYIKQARVVLPDTYEVNYVRPNHFSYRLPNLTKKQRINNIDKYIVKPATNRDVTDDPKYNRTVSQLINNHIKTFDLANREDNILYQTGGMVKYLLQFEYLDHQLNKYFYRMCTKKKYVQFISETFKLIISETDKTKYLIMNDLTFYLGRFHLAPDRIYRICILLSLSIKFYRLKKKSREITELELEQLIFMFGNITGSYYEQYQLTENINNIITQIIRHKPQLVPYGQIKSDVDIINTKIMSAL